MHRHEVMQDVRYGLRLLRKSPVFTIVAVLSLALGIGVTTAVVSLVDAWLLRPLPYPEADRLVVILRSSLALPDTPQIAALSRDLAHWQRESRSFEHLAGAFWRSYLVAGHGEPDSLNGMPDLLNGMIVTADLFDTIGVRPVIGRTFTPRDVGAGALAMIGHEIWQQRFGGSPSAIGATITLNGTTHQIIGVVPAGLGLRLLNQPFDPRVYTLIQPGEPHYGPDDTGAMAGIGRLKPGVSVTAARDELLAIQRRVDAKYTNGLKEYGVHVERLRENNARSVRSSLSVLAIGSACVLLVVCVNVASLLLGRATVRQKEMAVRTALGSTRRRLVRQLLTESALLSLLAIILGMGLAYAGVQAFVAMNPFQLLPQNAIALDGRVLAFVAALAIAITVSVGVTPALQVSRVDVQQVLRQVTRGASAGAASSRWRSVLVVAEIAVCVILLTGAALLLATVNRLSTEPLGIRPDGVTSIELSLPGDMGSTAARLNGFYDALIARMGALPGIEAVGIGGGPLYMGNNTTMTIDGAPDPEADRAIGHMREPISTGYFAALGIPLRLGRTFDRIDTAASEPVVVLNDAIVRGRFKGENPVGRRVRVGADKRWHRVIGVVGDTRSPSHTSLEWSTEQRVYVLLQQEPTSPTPVTTFKLWAYVRGPAPGAAVVRELVWALDPRIPVGKVAPFGDSIAEMWQQPRLRSAVLTTFALFALLLAVTGLYAVTSQWVALRVHELGIRTALGARARDLVTLVVRQGMTLAVIGVAAGLVGSLALAHGIATMLYGVTPADPVVLASVAGLLLASAALGCYLPARRAARVDPLVALRQD